MSYFTKKISKTYTFEGDSISVTMRRLKKKTAIKLAPMLGEPDEEGKFELTFKDQMEFMEEAGKILMEYVDEFVGLRDADGVEISLEDACGEDSEAYFMPLLSDMFGDLMEESFSKLKDKEVEKKSGSPSENISKECPTEQLEK